MYVQIQTVDGQHFQSDEFDLVSSGLNPIEFERIVADIEATFEDWPAAGHIGFEIGGRKRSFNPVNVLWAEIVY